MFQGRESILCRLALWRVSRKTQQRLQPKGRLGRKTFRKIPSKCGQRLPDSFHIEMKSCHESRKFTFELMTDRLLEQPVGGESQ